MESARPYENEHCICQISPLDLSNVVVHRSHFVIVLPYRFLTNKGLWKYINLPYYSTHRGLTKQSGYDYSNFFLIFASSECADKPVNCSIGPTNMTSVSGEKRHSDWDVNVVKVHLGANTPNNQNIF